MEWIEYFGIWAVKVKANNKQEAIYKIKKKILSYKDGSDKGDALKSLIPEHNFNPEIY